MYVCMFQFTGHTFAPTKAEESFKHEMVMGYVKVKKDLLKKSLNPLIKIKSDCPNAKNRFLGTHMLFDKPGKCRVLQLVEYNYKM